MAKTWKKAFPCTSLDCQHKHLKYFQGWLLVLGWSLSDLWGYSDCPTFIRRRSTGWSLNDWLRWVAHPTHWWLLGGASSSKASSYRHGRVGVPYGWVLGWCLTTQWCLFDVCLMFFLKNGRCEKINLPRVVSGFYWFVFICSRWFQNDIPLVHLCWKKRFDKFMSIPFFQNNVLEAAPLAILQNLRSLKLSTASASATAKLTELEVPQKKTPTMAHGHENSNIISRWGRCVQIRCLFCWITQVTLPCKLSYELFVPRGCVLRNTL